MDDIDIASELDPNKLFNEKEWIEVKATYPEVAPIYLSDARAKTLAIPEHLKERFLTGNEAVEDLRQYSTPPQSGELLYTPIPTWFSKDPPTVTDTDVFFSKSIPSPDHVNLLDKAYGQAWLDGAKSIVDRRVVNTMERLPVWTITVWKVLLGIKGAQREWNRALKWLESEEKKALRVGDVVLVEKLKEVRALAIKLPYEKKTTYLRGSATTKHLVHFMGTQLLTDDHINIMMHVLAEEVTIPKDDSQSGKEPLPHRKVLVAPLHFSNEVYLLKNKLKLPEAQWKRTLLSRYANRVDEEGVDALYFPIHINRNHWIAGEIDFKRNTISYGDSIRLESSEYIPHKFHENLRRWTRRAFGKNFTCEGNALQHAIQDDEYSCGIVTANTIEHAIHNNTPLWSPANASASRVDWFIRIVHNLNGTKWVRKPPGVEVPTEKLAAVREEMTASISTPEDDYNFPDHAEAVLYEILKNLDDGDSAGLDGAEERPKPGIPSSSIPPHPKRRMDISELLNPVGGGSSDGAESDTSSISCASVITEPEELSSPTAGEKRPAAALVDNPESSRAAPVLKRPSIYLGKDIEAELRAAEDLGDDIEGELREREKAGPSSQKKSAKNAKKLREEYEKGTLEVDVKGESYLALCQKIKEIDKGATIGTEYAQLFRPVCSRCQAVAPYKEPYDSTRFRSHYNACTGKQSKRSKVFNGPNLLAKFGFAKKAGPPSTEDAEKVDLPPPPRIMPCPGLTALEDKRIPVYLNRTPAPGGGARAVWRIAKEKFKRMFSELREKQKDEVLDTQFHEQKWKNDHYKVRVFSASCEKHVQIVNDKRPHPCVQCSAVLKSKPFRNAIGKPNPEAKNKKHTPYAFRNELLGKLYAEVEGLQDIFEAPSSEPCIQIAKRYLRGEMKDKEVFNGLMAAMATEQARKADGKGNQNFSYSPAYDELCQIVRDISPQAYKALSEHLQMPTIRGMQVKRAREPRFPMDICEDTFNLVAKQLKALGHEGPVALSCDDSKLLDALRLYWDEKDGCHYLVGAAEGKLKVADPDRMKELLEKSEYHKATKVRVWCLTLPSPKVTPIILAAVPITDALDADALFPMLKTIVDGLIDRDIRIVSYASDGTEVERNVSEKLLDMGERCEYVIPNPLPHQNRSDTHIPYVKYRGQAICIIQDSKHGLKTMRNNLFSGARLLVLGNHVAAYRRIREMADGPGSPIHKRDVEKVDRQDDNAASRLFSAATLKYLIDNHKDEALGEIVYLFVFGELIDAYQNRSMKHVDRIHLALRARYFLDSWETFLNVSGYPKSRYHVSREALDILDILVNGIIALVVIHRDHVDGSFPLLPWLNSTEPCEHVFGSARQVVKDFTFLDFIYMIPKLRVKLRQAVLHSQASDGKARAAGYNHTYFDDGGVDFDLLATFPTDDEIEEASCLAAEEAESLVKLLGIDADRLFIVNSLQESSKGPVPSPNPDPTEVALPPIAEWFPYDLFEDQVIRGQTEDDLNECFMDDDENDDDPTLTRNLVRTDLNDISLSAKDEHALEGMAMAGITAMAQDVMQVNEFTETTEDEAIEEILAEEYRHLKAMRARLASLKIPDIIEPTHNKSLAQDLTDAYLDPLVELRRKHQTRQAERGVRTRLTDSSDPSKRNNELKKELRGKFFGILKMYEDRKGVGTGLERGFRWRVAAAGGRTGVVDGEVPEEPSAGNSSNAVGAAVRSSNQLLLKRQTAFETASIPSDLRALISNAGVDVQSPIQLDDFCLVLEDGHVRLAKVITLYQKTAGKNGKHGAITDSSVITAVSYLGVQVFENTRPNYFSMYPRQTALLRTLCFSQIPSSQVLLRLSPKNIKPSHPNKNTLVMDSATYTQFADLKKQEAKLVDAVKLYKARNFAQAVQTYRQKRK
ncbi:hypothetical protein D9611_001095 [Ephemerocybe angulata]|uniref:Ubiquitin-like protease family profile domain-containing protein n=1 Tax=Ephemerocybe angulata TaxID=980116 RepID=A0A8H5CI52_9AGAR|nr:hypothetical protein D9611_001095 [Tulosesus angulatus]